MSAALLDPPKVLKGNPGVLVEAPVPEDTASYEKYWATIPTGETKTITAGIVVGYPTIDWAVKIENVKFENVKFEDCKVKIEAQPATPAALEALKRGALEWVNALRTEWGFPALEQLPKGRARSRLDCVIARALPHALSVDSTVRLKSGYRITVPMEVLSFIARFDSGRYPELIA